MDKASSVIAAFEAGKLPSTQQFNAFIDWVNDVGLTQVDASISQASSFVKEASVEAGVGNVNDSELSSQGKVLANNIRRILDAYKRLATNKNSDNILQQAIFHLSQGELTPTSQATSAKNTAKDDVESLRKALHTLIMSLWTSVSSETTSLSQDILSLFRSSLADAAELIETQAGSAKEGIRHVEDEVQAGKRDALGRDKKSLEEERQGGAQVQWEHGMDTVKGAGSTVIGAAQTTSAKVQENKEKTSSRLQDTLYRITDRAQSDPEYRHALDTVFGIIQTRLNTTIDAASDPNTTLSSFIADPSPEQHVHKALENLRTLIERLADGTSLEPLIQKFRTAAYAIVKDDELKKWFDDFLGNLRRSLTDAGYARSEEGQAKRKELRVRWRTQLEKDADGKWKAAVEGVKEELMKVQQGLERDEDVNRLKDAHAKLGDDLERGLAEASDVGEGVKEKAKTTVQAAIEQATWFWQDLFKVYLPRLLNKMRDVPIPRTEFKDDEIEFVLENLDVSSFNILPSHVYIRNITDIDIQTSANPSKPSHTALGTLTHIRIQALQLALKDVSFWYKDKTASSLGPSEFTGLLGLTLPEKGVDVDLKVRLIPADKRGKGSREDRKHFNVIESCAVSISEDVGIEVRESNHTVLVTLFRPMMVARLRQALEKTLTEQVRGLVEWADGVAFDVGKRREVFEDTGLGGGGSLVAAVWSEIGRLERESRDGQGVEMNVKATGTGVIVEQKVDVSSSEPGSRGSDEIGKEPEMRKTSMFAMGAEPQILSGDKRGPLGTGSERLVDKLERVTAEGREELGGAMDLDVEDYQRVGAEGVKNLKREVQSKAKGVKRDVQGLVKEGERQVRGFRKSVERKKVVECGREGWESRSFDV